MQTPSSDAAKPHAILYVRRERKWPFQIIGRCRCGKAIRCNSTAEAEDFLAPCREAATDA